MTQLPCSVIDNVISVMESQGLLETRNTYNLPEYTRKILALSDFINFFNVNAPPNFSDILKNEDDDFEVTLLFFKPNLKLISDSDDIHYIKILIAADVAGDFLCE